jgi:hypothetical protein
MNRLIVGAFAASIASVAVAGPTVLGTPLGSFLGVGLGGFTVLGADLPIGALLAVAAMSLVLGIFIVRRKIGR